MNTLAAIVREMRPRQWTKNLIVYLPLLFAGMAADVEASLRASAAFAIFCLISGVVYLFNDIVDQERDQNHEVKRLRPVASGVLSVRAAATAASVLSAIAALAAISLGAQFAAVAAAYAGLQVIYSLHLKHRVILDVVAISAGFVLRALAGAAAIGVGASHWLYTCAALLALFLGLAKRRHELVALEGCATDHRPSLEHYSTGLINWMLASVAAATTAAYIAYTLLSETAQGNRYLTLTIPFVVYGLGRYLYLVYRKNLGGSPEEVLLSDLPLIAGILVWLAAAGSILYLT